jgi:hypothetical protein
MGTKGTADVMRHVITDKGKVVWRYQGPPGNMYQYEHNELFASIRNQKPINDGDWMTKSTLMGIMGRYATYTGEVITWDKLMKSDDSLLPAKLEFGPLTVPPVAKPGLTKFA